MAKRTVTLNGYGKWIPLVIVAFAACIGYGKLTGTVARNTTDIRAQAKMLSRIDRIVSGIAGKLGVPVEEERD